MSAACRPYGLGWRSPLSGTFRRLLAALMAASSLGAAGAEPLHLAVSEGPVSLPIYVAEAERLFEREGVDVRLHPCKSGRDCYQQLVRGDVNLATASELVMTLDSANEPDTAIVATISSSTHSIKLVARREAGIARAADLRGKRIGTTKGTSAQYFLDSWLVFHGIDPAEVTVVGLSPDQLSVALEKRELDAIAIWDPSAARAIATLGPAAIVLPDPRVYTQHFNLMATRRLIAREEAALVRMLRALVQAERFIAAHPARAAHILSRRLSGYAAPLNTGDHDYRLSLNQSLIGTMDAQARWAVGRGLMPASRRPGNLLRSIEPSLLRAASPPAVNLVR